MKKHILLALAFSLLVLLPNAPATSIDAFLDAHDNFNKTTVFDPLIPNDIVYRKRSSSSLITVYVRSSKIIAYEFQMKIPNEEFDTFMKGAKDALITYFPPPQFSINKLDVQLSPDEETSQLTAQIVDVDLYREAKEAENIKTKHRISEFVSEFAPKIQP